MKTSEINKGKFSLSTELIAIASITSLVLTLLTPTSVHASCASPLDDGGFEQQTTGSVLKPWFREGQAGIDLNKGLSLTGRNNAWIRNSKGWNGIRQPVKLTAGSTYTVTARVRTSGNLSDGYFGFRNAQQKPVAEIKFGAMASYKELKAVFRPQQSGTYYVFTGLWALNQDTWAQVDEFRMTGGSCADT
jgi:hypothetical protein